MNNPEHQTPNSPSDALDSSDISELVDQSLVESAMAEIDSLLVQATREPSDAAHQDDDVKNQPARSPSTSAASALIVDQDQDLEDLDALVPPTPDIDEIPPDVAALFEQPNDSVVERVTETPQRDHSSDDILRLTPATTTTDLEFLQLVPPPTGSFWPGTSDSPRSFLQRVRQLREGHSSAQQKAKRLLAPRRTPSASSSSVRRSTHIMPLPL